MKKLIVLNILIIIVGFSTCIFAYHVINFEAELDLHGDFKKYGLQYYLLAAIFFALIAWLISSIEIKNLSSKTKFLASFFTINCLFLIFLLYSGIPVFLKNKKEFEQLKNKTISKAKEDIKNDKIVFEYSGGFVMLEEDSIYNQKINTFNAQKDQIFKKYGIEYINYGCIIDESKIVSQKEYKKAVEPYLEKRNGENWEEKMNAEINSIK